MLSIYDIVCGSVGALFLGLRLLFAAWRQTGRLAMCCVSIPPGRDRHSRVLDVSVRLSGLAETRSWSARRCGSVAAFGVRFASVLAALSRCFAFGSRLLFVSRQTGRLAIACVPIPPGRDRHSCVLAVLVRLSAFVGSLRACTFLCGDLDGVPRTLGTENGERGWRRGLCASLRKHIGFAVLSAGSTLGLRAPNLRQRVFDSLDSLHAAAGLRWCVFAPPSPGYTERPARL